MNISHKCPHCDYLFEADVDDSISRLSELDKLLDLIWEHTYVLNTKEARPLNRYNAAKLNLLGLFESRIRTRMEEIKHGKR